MTAPHVPCDTCGASIPDSDFETGTAIALLGRSYCPRCKGDAVKRISLEDLAPKAPPVKSAAPKPPAPVKAAAAKTPAPAKPAARPPAPAPAARPAAGDGSGDTNEDAPQRTLGPRRKPSLKKSPSKLLVWAAAGIAVLIVTLTGVLFLVQDGKTPSGGKGPSAGKTPDGKPAAALSPAEQKEKKAREAMLAVEELASRSASADAVLAAIDQARAACRGTQFEAPLEALRVKTIREKETGEAVRELNPLIDELKAAVASDPEFKRYAELQPKFQRARDLSVRSGQNRGDIQALQSDYGVRYEKAAEPFYDPIHTAATVLADERRYDDALARIETFPAHLRHTGAWKSLERLKQDIERRKKSLPRK